MVYRPGYNKRDDSWFQYYFDAIGYPHTDDPKGEEREISPKYRRRFGVKSSVPTPINHNNWIILCISFSSNVLLQLFLYTHLSNKIFGSLQPVHLNCILPENSDA